eukprot:1161072-Pyramimonas_sp.AAC.1
MVRLLCRRILRQACPLQFLQTADAHSVCCLACRGRAEVIAEFCVVGVVRASAVLEPALPARAASDSGAPMEIAPRQDL